MIQKLTPLFKAIQAQLGGIKVQTSVYLKQVQDILFTSSISKKEAYFIFFPEGLVGLIELCSTRKTITGNLKNSAFNAMNLLAKLLFKHQDCQTLKKCFDQIERDAFSKMMLSAHIESQISRQSALQVARFIKVHNSTYPVENYILSKQARQIFQKYCQNFQVKTQTGSEGLKDSQKKPVQTRVLKKLKHKIKQFGEVGNQFQDPFQLIFNKMGKIFQHRTLPNNIIHKVKFMHIQSPQFNPQVLIDTLHMNEKKVFFQTALQGVVELIKERQDVQKSVLYFSFEHLSDISTTLTKVRNQKLGLKGDSLQLLEKIKVSHLKLRQQASRFKAQFNSLKSLNSFLAQLTTNPLFLDCKPLLKYYLARKKHLKAIQLFRQIQFTANQDLKSLILRSVHNQFCCLRRQLLQILFEQMDTQTNIIQNFNNLKALFEDKVTFQNYMIKRAGLELYNKILINVKEDVPIPKPKEIQQYQFQFLGIQRSEESLHPVHQFIKKYKLKIDKGVTDPLTTILNWLNNLRILRNHKEKQGDPGAFKLIHESIQKLIVFFCKEISNRLKKVSTNKVASLEQMKLKYKQIFNSVEKVLSELRTWRLAEEALSSIEKQLTSTILQTSSELKVGKDCGIKQSRIIVDIFQTRTTLSFKEGLHRLVQLVQELVQNFQILKISKFDQSKPFALFLKSFLQECFSNKSSVKEMTYALCNIRALKVPSFLTPFLMTLALKMQGKTEIKLLTEFIQQVVKQLQTSISQQLTESLKSKWQKQSTQIFNELKDSQMKLSIYSVIYDLHSTFSFHFKILQSVEIVRLAFQKFMETLASTWVQSLNASRSVNLMLLLTLTNGLQKDKKLLQIKSRLQSQLAKSASLKQNDSKVRSIMIQQKFKQQVRLAPLFIY